MSEHTWFQDRLTYHDTLSSEERERFERHAAACAVCAETLADSKEFERTMEDLFVPARPDAGFEKRVVEGFRRAASQVRMPRWLWVAATAAALLFLAGVGALAQHVLAEERLPSATALRAAKEIEFYPPALALIVKAPSRTHTSITDANKAPQGERVDPSNISGSDGRGPDVLGDLYSGLTGKRELTRDLDINGEVDKLRAMANLSDGVQLRGGEEKLNQMLRGLSADGRTTAQNNLKQLGAGVEVIVPDDGTVTMGGLHRYSLSVKAPPVAGPTTTSAAGSVALARAPDANQPATKYFRVDGKTGKSNDGKVGQSAQDGEKREEGHKANEKAGAYFYAPQVAWNDSGKEEKKEQAKDGPSNLGFGLGMGRAGVPKSDPSGKQDVKAPGKDTVVAFVQQPPPPETVARKIIRTGDVEFEIDGFDAAVDEVTKLVNAVKGGFVATVNSDKLANGKVRGSVVVRMPPEFLDKFLLDMRRALGKMGELKSQRIGSADVSKQYYDIESRLKAARTMEERLLKVIKDGKGEIKDLVAAEKELGVTRTRIEEMEGEIRYYNAQIGLSTLTITLVEKEIQAPAALVETERVRMSIEVEDVDKARQAVLAAVTDAKGRLTKSDMKQHAAGQLQAFLNFEVAPDKADKVRESLRQLGVVTSQEADRTQQAVGGTGRMGEVKTKQNDVKFEVELHNVANYQPREALEMTLAAQDVPAAFRKLQEAVAQVQGWVRAADLNEQDKLNITAEFKFDVLVTDRKSIDKAIDSAGKIVSRNTTQAKPNETYTDRKVGFRLTIKSIASLPTRDDVAMTLEVADVDKSTAAVFDVVRAKNGVIGKTVMLQERDGVFVARLNFKVPADAKDAVLDKLKTTGTVRVRTASRNPQVPDGDLASAEFTVVLTTSTPIVPPGESLGNQVGTRLYYCFKILVFSLSVIFWGVCFLLPFAILGWVIFKVVKRWRKVPA